MFQRKTPFPTAVLNIHFNPVDGDSMSLQNDGTHLADYTTVTNQTTAILTSTVNLTATNFWPILRHAFMDMGQPPIREALAAFFTLKIR